MAREGPAAVANRDRETSSVSQWWDGKWEGLAECLDHTEATITQQLLQAGRCWCVMTRTLEQEESQRGRRSSSQL